jgi:hypothetical protein
MGYSISLITDNISCPFVEVVMPYSERLFPWCILRRLPNAKYLVVARFRRRNDAIAHLQVLKQLVKNASFEIVFDAQTDSNLSKK